MEMIMATVAMLEPVGKLTATQALARAYALALEKFPEAQGRLTKALELVQTGGVFETGSHEWEVASQSEGGYPHNVSRDYKCDCDWSHYNPQAFCTHALASMLQKKAMKLLAPMPQPASPVVETQEETEAPAPEPVTTAPESSSGQALVPVTTAPLTTTADLAGSLTAWTEQRALITGFVKAHFKEGIDYYTLTVGGKESKPSLSKAGSKKFLGLFHLAATFHKDDETWEMLGRSAGVLCYRCELHTTSGEVVGEGRGCRDAHKEKDLNKAIKMAQKSAQIDAVLRTGALSDVYTQDLEDMPETAEVRTKKQAA
jgi:hypothetical protein